MNRTAYACLAVASLLAASPAFAEIEQQAAQPDVTVSPVDGVVVTANRSAQPIERVGASVTVLNDETIRASQATNVAELLSRTPGISYTRNGGVGASSSLSIRGAEGHHTVVLIDGVKLNDPSSTQGGFNFGNLLVGDTARIEVLRGAQSTLWGSQAIGGVVNIVTAAPTKPFQASLDAEAGARGTAYVRGGVGIANDRLNLRLAASHYETDGFSAYATGTEADGYSNTGLSGRLNLKVTDTISLDLRSVYSDGKNDFDAWNGDSSEYGKTRELVAYAGLNIDLLDGRFRNRIGLAYTDTKRRNFSPETLVQPLTFDAKGENRRWEYQGTFAVLDTLTTTFGVESERAEMRTRSPSAWDLDPAFGRGKADIDSVYGQVQWTLAPGLTLTGGLRYDDHQQYGDNLLGQVAAAWVLNEQGTVLRASFGQGFRAPGLYELYSDYGNLTLKPEEFDSWEIGAEQRLFDRATVSAAYFNRQADNEIRYNSCGATPDPLCTVNGVSRWGYYSNLLKTEAQGVELIGRVDVSDRLNLSANYTWTDAKNASGAYDGKRLVRRPEHMANLAADYSWPVGLKTGVAVRYVGKTFTNDANTATLKDYALVDLRVSYPINDTVELYGRVENAFDEAYQTVLNYGTAGRGAFAGVRARF